MQTKLLNKSLWEMFGNSVKNNLNKPIFHLSPHNSIKYYDFYKTICDQKLFLQNQNIKKGDIVLVVGKNTHNWASLSYAINSVGGIFVPMFEEQQNEITSHMLNQIKPKIIFNSTSKSILHMYENFEKDKTIEINHEKHIFSNNLLEIKLNTEPDLSENDIAVILYTSGTSGFPKGVPLTNKNILSNIESINFCSQQNSNCSVSSDDKFLSFLPWYHSYGFTGELNYVIYSGASIYRNNKLENLRRDIVDNNPTVICAVPRLFQLMHNKVRLIEKTPKTPNFLLPTVNKIVKSKLFGKNIRFCTVGGSAMPPDTLNFFNNMGLNIYEGYGTTECSPMITLNNPQQKGSVGKILGCNDVMIDTDSTEETLDVDRSMKIYYNNNNIGEILVSGTNVMSNYLGFDKVVSHKYINGKYWYKTGDVGYVENGYLYLTGRIKEQYKLSNGKFVNPVDLENILLSIPEIKQVVVFGKDEEFNTAIIVTNVDESLIKSKIELIKHKFKKYEIPQKLILTKEEFTTENGLLTQKKSQKRNEIISKYTYKI